MARIVAEIHHQHQQLGAEQADQGGIDGQVGDFLGIETGAAGEPQSEEQSGEETEGDQEAVGGQVESADGEKLGYMGGQESGYCSRRASTKKWLSPGRSSSIANPARSSTR